MQPPLARVFAWINRKSDTRAIDSLCAVPNLVLIVGAEQPDVPSIPPPLMARDKDRRITPKVGSGGMAEQDGTRFACQSRVLDS